MRTLAIAAYTAILMLGACASAPAYSPASSPMAMGYSDQRIEDDRWRVTYRGDTTMSSGDVQDYALMRAAQVTLEHGGDWFEVVTADTDADAKRRYSTETDYHTDYAVQRSCGLLGCTNKLVPVMTRTEREVADTRTVYEHAVEFRIGKGAKLDGSPRIYDAHDTFSTLQARLS
ncbi:MAG: hypothetical protein R3C46_03415 [Hyphomonadaceae bacterium]